MLNKATIFILSRPFGSIKGTGIERYSLGLYNSLKERELNVTHISEVTATSALSSYTEAYQSFLSPILFDAFMCTEYIIKIGRVRPSKNFLIHITEPLQAFFTPIIRRTITDKIILTVHDLFPLLNPKPVKKTEWFWNLAFYLSLKLSLPNVKQIIVSTKQVKDGLVNILKVPSEKIVVIKMGLEEKFKQKVSVDEKFRRKERIIGCVGALFLRKRFDKALYVFSQLKQMYRNPLKLVICGRGPGLSNLKSMASELGISEDVEFLGYVSEKEIVDYYNSFDVFFHPSEYEGFGFPILEAQACGVPVVIYRDAEIPEEVRKCSIEVKDDYSAAEAIFKLISNFNFYKKISEDSLDHARNFMWSKIIDEVIKVYERNLSQ